MRVLSSFSCFRTDHLADDSRSFLDDLPKFKPFIFPTGDLSLSDNNTKSNNKIYLPFRHCSFDVTSPIKIEVSGGWLRKRPDIKFPIFIGAMLRENDNLSIDELLVHADAYGPDGNVQDLIDITKPLKNIYISLNKYKSYEYLWAGARSNIFLNLLSSTNIYTGISHARFEIKRKGSHPDFVKRLVVISSNGNLKTIEKSLHEKIDWQHQWRVRGHWRKISPNMIGKNREGEYAIVGRTWVKDFVKGDGPLIEKTRIFKGDKNVRSEQSNSTGPINA